MGKVLVRVWHGTVDSDLKSFRTGLSFGHASLGIYENRPDGVMVEKMYASFWPPNCCSIAHRNNPLYPCLEANSHFHDFRMDSLIYSSEVPEEIELRKLDEGEIIDVFSHIRENSHVKWKLAYSHALDHSFAFYPITYSHNTRSLVRMTLDHSPSCHSHDTRSRVKPTSLL